MKEVVSWLCAKADDSCESISDPVGTDSVFDGCVAMTTGAAASS